MSEMQSTTGKANPNFFEKQVLKFDNARFAWMAMGITLQSCLGSVACMYILKNNGGDVPLILCATVTMASNAFFIAQAPSKWCVGGFYLSVILNAIFIVMYV